jgi:hypothetical protein
LSEVYLSEYFRIKCEVFHRDDFKNSGNDEVKYRDRGQEKKKWKKLQKSFGE